MEKILRTDNATQAINKINANFADIPTSVSSDVVAEGTIVGNGSEYVNVYLNKARPGDLLRIDFPNGNWTDAASGSNKLAIGYRDASGTVQSLYLVSRGTVVENSYEAYLSPRLANDFDFAYFAIRAAVGQQVPYVVTRIDEMKVRSYFQAELADTVAKVKDRQVNNCATFAVITDIHYRCYINDDASIAPWGAIATAANIAEIAREVRLDNVLCLGDVIDGRSTVHLSSCDATDIMRAFSMTDVPLLFSIGNHDDNRYFSQGSATGDRRFTGGEIYANFYQSIDERTSVGGAMNGCDYYRDIERLKIRIISICAIDFSGNYKFSVETQSWLTSTFASMPEGWKAILFTHIPPFPAHTWGGNGYTGGDATALIIKDNVDKVLAVYQGHTHLDNVFLNPYTAISLSCGKCYSLSVTETAPEGSTFPARYANDSRQDLFDIVVFDLENSLMSCIRFGAGVDRYIHTVPVLAASGSSVTLVPAVLDAVSWAVRASESESISVSSGIVTVAAGATSGSRLTTIARDADGNMEIWCIKVS